MERALAASSSGRAAFAASLWKRAAAAATALHGRAALAAAYCTLKQTSSLCSQASLEASPLEKRALDEEAFELASSVLPLVSTRMDDNMLLPGRCTTEEVEFFKRYTMAKRRFSNTPPLSDRGLQLNGFGVGYAVGLYAAGRVLFQFLSNVRPPPPALAFVLRAVDMVCNA